MDMVDMKNPWSEDLEVRIDRLHDLCRIKDDEIVKLYRELEAVEKEVDRLRAKDHNDRELGNQIYDLQREVDYWKKAHDDIKQDLDDNKRSFFGLFYDSEKAALKKLCVLLGEDVEEIQLDRDYYKRQAEQLHKDVNTLTHIIDALEYTPEDETNDVFE